MKDYYTLYFSDDSHGDVVLMIIILSMETVGYTTMVTLVVWNGNAYLTCIFGKEVLKTMQTRKMIV